MNKEQIMEAMNHIDPALIEAADRDAAVTRRGRSGWRRAAVIAACLCLILAGTALAAELAGVRVVEFFHHELRDINPNWEPESYSGYTVAGDVRYFPLSELSPEINELNQTITWATCKSFPSWEDMEEFVGIRVMDNPVLADAPAGGGFDLGIPGGSGKYVVCVSANPIGEGTPGIDLRGSFLLHGVRSGGHWKSGVQVNMKAGILTEFAKDWEQEYGLDMSKASVYYPDCVELTLQEYVTPSGLPVQIFRADYPEEGTTLTNPRTGETEPYTMPGYTRYDARFTLNGMMFSVSATDYANVNGVEDPGLAWSTLLEVLDGFVCTPAL